MVKNKLAGLYLISPSEFSLNEFSNTLEEILKGGDIAAFQLRLKHSHLDDIAQATKQLLPLCKKYKTPFIINDHVEIARNFDIDGIHLGEDDDSIKNVRAEFGPELIIGASCYNSKDLAKQNAAAGASYIALGAFFPSKSKNTEKRADLTLLRWCTENINLPCAVIGGINLENLNYFNNSKPDLICSISAIWQHPLGAKYAAKQFTKTIRKNQTATVIKNER